MSIGVYAFLRIIFSALACPFGRALLDTLPARRRYDLPGVACLVSGADRCSVSSVRACVSVRRVLHGLPLHLVRPAQCSPSRCAGWGRGAPAGYTAAAQPRPVSPVTTEKIKKAQKITLPPIVNLKNFPQKQKDPYKGSVFCAILALQALKGRNLQWLKAK